MSFSAGFCFDCFLKAGKTKDWFRKLILEVVASDEGDEDFERAREQLEELDHCPCDDMEKVDSKVECPCCRQWWHHECAEVKDALAVKAFKKCKNCVDMEKRIEGQKKDGRLGFFDNDLKDLHK